ncbi:LysR family transcriptional regulator [Bradyrhizobium prioriisuperbiae]|uniref:LysR family transcriptional regulator n=1 Tax=Bradyrhizobium prioriisuperbiae TaxID=2854389 RepID=UPI0028E6C1E4|nr:LysR family transcriptional regulator [Bradyrhizobium prioritasuperba]
MLDLKALETFVCVTDLQSFRRAATKLNATQPAISQRIAQLERLLGHKLLHRDGRYVVPTPHGRELLDYALRILVLRDELMLAVGGAASFTGVLRLGSSETLVHTWLPDFIRTINENFPKLILEIEVDISARLLERLFSFEIDLAFMVGPVALPQIHTRPISRYPVAFIASPSLGLGKTQISIETLSKYPIVTFLRRTQPFHAVETMFFGGTRRLPIRLHASASLATATRMALDGQAVAAIPPAILLPHLKSGELEILDVDAELPDLQFITAWHDAKTSPAIFALVDKASKIASENKGC